MESDNGDFDDFACDCIVARLYEALPGSPSYKGFYINIYNVRSYLMIL